MRGSLFPWLVVLLLLGGCGRLDTPPPSPTPSTPVPLTPTAPSTVPVEAISCEPELQVIPFRDEAEPDYSLDALPLCYRLRLDLDESGESFTGLAQIAVRNDTQDPWAYLLFRLYPASSLLYGGEITVGQVRIDGAPVTATRTLADQTGLEVPLPLPLAPGESVEVTVDYTGELASLNQADRVYGIFARTEHAVTLTSWFPMLAIWDEEDEGWLDVPVLGEGDAVFAQSALIHATLNAPDRFDLAASGIHVEIERDNGRVTYEVVTGPARDLALVWMEGYEEESIYIEGTLIRNWFLPDDQVGADLALQAAQEALVLFNDTFGPYPFEELDIVEVPLRGAGGVEYPQLFLLGQELYGHEESHDFLRFASAHETAHQWWYSTVGSDINQSPWQDESLTNWSSLFWLERYGGVQAAEQLLDNYEAAVRQIEEAEGTLPITESLYYFQGNTDAYVSSVYVKGLLFFEALRQEIGEEAFLTALQRYYEAHLFDIATPDALLESFEQASGRDLSLFYESWGVRSGSSN